MKNYKLVGLTGATGAGKSEVAELFRENGYEVIYADFLAREIMNNPVVLSVLRENFGDDVAIDNKLNRKLLAERAFKDSDTKNLLDSITHPYISVLFLSELKRLNSFGAERILFDASQLLESSLDVICDCVIAVTAPESVRLNRITERDGLTAEQAEKRMKVQFSDDYFREHSDYLLENNSDFNSLKKEVSKTIKNLEVRFGSD